MVEDVLKYVRDNDSRGWPSPRYINSMLHMPAIAITAIATTVIIIFAISISTYLTSVHPGRVLTLNFPLTWGLVTLSLKVSDDRELFVLP